MKRLLPITICAPALGAVAVAIAFAQPAPVPRSPAGGPDPEAARRAQPVARYEGGSITVGELEDAIANKALVLRKELAEQAGRRRMLEQLLDWELLVAEAARRGYGEHTAVRDGATRRAVQLLKLEVMSAVDPAALSQEALQAFYEERRALLSAPPLRRASYVKLESQAEAADFRRSVLRMDVDEFRRLAVRMDDSGRGGELGYVDADGRPGGNPQAQPLDAELTRAAYALDEVGAVSQPIPYQGGFIILRLTARTPGHGQTLAEVEEAVRAQLAEQAALEAVETLVARLREANAPELDRKPLEAARFDFPAPPEIPQGFPAAPPDPTAPTIVVEPDGV